MVTGRKLPSLCCKIQPSLVVGSVAGSVARSVARSVAVSVDTVAMTLLHWTPKSGTQLQLLRKHQEMQLNPSGLVSFLNKQ